jgi:carbonic anhydrase
VENVSVINVKRAVNSIIERSSVLEQMVKRGEIGIIGAMYNVETGYVDFYPETFQFNSTKVLVQSFMPNQLR